MTNATFFQAILRSGIHSSMSDQEQRSIQLSNLLNLLIFLLSLVLALVLWLTVPQTPYAFYTLLNAIIFLGLLLLSRAGFSLASRMAVCVVLPTFTLAVAVLGKQAVLRDATVGIAEMEYVHTRLPILISAIFPLLLFSTRKQLHLLLLAFIPGLLSIVFYDLVHEFFQVGYGQVGHASPFYPFTGVLFSILYIVLAISFYFYKRLLEDTEASLLTNSRQLSQLYDELHDQNKTLQLQQEEMQAQQEELQAQNEEIALSREMLASANQVIAEQKQNLETENQQLNQILIEKNELLEATNTQLQKRLEEVRQFSYTISHNLRGPVASLLGLFSLFDPKNASKGNLELAVHAQTTLQALDSVIRDLSKVLEVRDGLVEGELVNLPQLVDNVHATLKISLQEKQGVLHRELKVIEFRTEKSYLHSILYNLLSNAIKYAMPGRPLEIQLCCRQVNQQVEIRVKDNGRGINLKEYGQDLFKLYKRFHLGEEGRGLGLYLIKVQTEALGGRVSVDSKVGEGSTFTVILPQPKEI